jgi:tRNA threonylcarbamoyladenosine biosynthesis protein TsaE
MNRIVNNICELNELLAQFAQSIPEKLIVLLEGEPGAGKTHMVKSFVKAIARSSGIPSDQIANLVSSPTFALHQNYNIPQGANAGLEIDHWDLYRLESEDDLESSGFWDQFSRPKLTVFIEWPERLNESWLPNDIAIWKFKIEILGETQRQISMLRRHPKVTDHAEIL